MNGSDKFWPKGSTASGTSFAGAGWILWVVAAVCIAFTLWLLIDAWRVRNRMRRVIAMGKAAAKEPLVTDGGDQREPTSRGHILVTCQHCQRGILVPKARRFHEVDCPACGETNPAPKKDRLALIKVVLRWLLYPSFQDRD